MSKMSEAQVLLAENFKKQTRSQMIWHQYKKSPGAMIGMFMFIGILLVAVISSLVVDFDTQIANMDVSIMLAQPGTPGHPLGTDHLGRDVLTRLLYGTRYSLIIGFCSVAISLVVGTFLGAIAGYYGGKVETIIMRIVELLLLIPAMLLTIILIAALGINMRNLIISFGCTTIPHFARNARASVLTIAGNEYVEAAKAVGASDLAIIFKHILPNALSPIFVQATSRVAGCITSAATFSFLGLGVPAPLPEWGAMLSDAKQYMRSNPTLLLFPGLAILILCLAINLIGDGLRDALDPKMKR